MVKGSKIKPEWNFFFISLLLFKSKFNLNQSHIDIGLSSNENLKTFSTLNPSWFKKQNRSQKRSSFLTFKNSWWKMVRMMWSQGNERGNKEISCCWFENLPLSIVNLKRLRELHRALSEIQKSSLGFKSVFFFF